MLMVWATPPSPIMDSNSGLRSAKEARKTRSLGSKKMTIQVWEACSQKNQART